MTVFSQEAWTDSEELICIKLWNDGISSTQIGKKLKRSRNSVLGWINRNQDRVSRKAVKKPQRKNQTTQQQVQQMKYGELPAPITMRKLSCLDRDISELISDEADYQGAPQ